MAGVGAPHDASATTVRLLDSTGCVLDDATELGRGGAPDGTVVAALSQTEGRARRGHVWRSPEGGLYLAVLLRPDVAMQQLMGLAPVCSLGVLDALRSMGAEGIGLKWPDDLVVGDRKLGTVLIEAGYGSDGVFAVCGVMLNVDKVPGLEDELLAARDGSVAPLAPVFLRDHVSTDPVCEGGFCRMGGLPALDDVAAALRDAVVARVHAWEADVRAGHAAAGPYAPSLGEYYDELVMVGDQVRALLPDGRACATGRLSGMDVWGHAIVTTAAGEEASFSPEQATIRPLVG